MNTINQLLLILSFFLLIACGTAQQQSSSEKAKYHHRLAYGHFFENGDSNAALQDALMSLKLDPKSAEVHMLIGLIYTGRSDLLKALKHYRTAIEIKPDYYEAKNNLGTVYLSLKMWKKAIEVFSELCKRDDYRTPAMGFNNLGWAYYKLGKIEQAQKQFMTATQLDPKLCPPHNNLGLTYLSKKQIERAKLSFETSKKLCPQYAEPYLHLGQLHQQLGDIKQAEVEWKNCQRLAATNDVGIRCKHLVQRIQP